MDRPVVDIRTVYFNKKIDHLINFVSADIFSKRTVGEYLSITDPDEIRTRYFCGVCLHIGKGKPLWKRTKSHYKAVKGGDTAIKRVKILEQYQKYLKIYWVEFKKLDEPLLDDQL